MPDPNDSNAQTPIPRGEKNSLAAFKKPPAPAKSILRDKPKSKAKPKLGRKAKAKAEKESEQVALMLRPAEHAALKKAAGLIPIGTFLKDYLRRETTFLGKHK